MKNIAILGGNFDPPHLGHLKLVEYLLENTCIDLVEVIPCGMPKHKEPHTEPHHRLEMALELFASVDPVNVSLSDLKTDIYDRGSGSLLHLMTTAKNKWDEVVRTSGFIPQSGVPSNNFYCAIGQDLADQIRYFYKWEELISSFRFIVFPRGYGSQSDDAWYRKEPHIFLDKFEPFDTSSNLIRQDINHELLTEGVREYIKTHQLYK